MKTLQQVANSIARKAGYGFATEIVIGAEDKVLRHIHFGYRKNTTGEYVPHKYVCNFGWKNTYYQHAKTIVQVAASSVPVEVSK